MAELRSHPKPNAAAFSVLLACLLCVARPGSWIVLASLPAVAAVSVQLIAWLRREPEALVFVGLGVSLMLLNTSGSAAALMVSVSVLVPFLVRTRGGSPRGGDLTRLFVWPAVTLAAWSLGSLFGDGTSELFSRAIFVVTGALAAMGGRRMGAELLLSGVSRVLPIPVAVSLYLAVGPGLLRDVGSRETKIALTSAGPVNLLGAVIALCLIANVALLLTGSRLLLDIASLVLTSFLTVVLLSRTAIAAALVTLGVVVIVNAVSGEHRRRRVLRAAGFAAWAVAVSPLFLDFVASNELLRGRAFLWNTGRSLAMRTGVFGIGYLGIEPAKAPLIVGAAHESTGGGFHSLVIDTWLGAGLLGLGALFLLGVFLRRPFSGFTSPIETSLAHAVWAMPFVYGVLRATTESSGWLIDKNVNVLSATLWMCVGASVHAGGSQTPASWSSEAKALPQDGRHSAGSSSVSP